MFEVDGEGKPMSKAAQIVRLQGHTRPAGSEGVQQELPTTAPSNCEGLVGGEDCRAKQIK